MTSPNAMCTDLPSPARDGELDSQTALRLTAAPQPPEPRPMVFPSLPAHLTPIVLLSLSNVFMTFAWYGHLRFKEQPLVLVIFVSWFIAFFEYCLAVPANRYGSAVYSAAELKTMQEVITLVVFAVFSTLYLKEPMGLNQIIGFGFIAVGAFFVFSGRA
jgi:uncharacterized protein (DUF486 family)